MKKIMFSDKYSLTKAVLEGRKTQTRRIVDVSKLSKMQIDSLDDENSDLGILTMGNLLDDSRYKVGEEVAVAQRYRDVCHEVFLFSTKVRGKEHRKGWANKMFVKADLMPHRIKITNIRIERLQDISEEDCLKEGVCTSNFTFDVDRYFVEGIKRKGNTLCYKDENGWCHPFKWQTYDTPQRAFASLINKTCGKGTWQSNPYVFVYDFELIKQ